MLAVTWMILGCFGSSEPAPSEAPAAAPEPVEEPEPSPTLLTLTTSEGELGILPVYHATLQMTLGDVVVVFDPWTKAGLSDMQADFIFVTDVHPDHMDPEAIRRIAGEGTQIVAPAAVAEHEAMAEFEVAHVMANGDEETVGPFTVRAVPMYNLERGPEEGGVYHPKGRGNGYVLTVGGKSVYVAGDTECTEEMKALEGIDHAFVPMNLPYTMTPEEAAECVLAFNPQAVTAIHYWGSDLEKFEGELLTVEGMMQFARADLYTKGAPF